MAVSRLIQFFINEYQGLNADIRPVLKAENVGSRLYLEDTDMWERWTGALWLPWTPPGGAGGGGGSSRPLAFAAGGFVEARITDGVYAVGTTSFPVTYIQGTEADVVVGSPATFLGEVHSVVSVAAGSIEIAAPGLAVAKTADALNAYLFYQGAFVGPNAIIQIPPQDYVSILIDLTYVLPQMDGKISFYNGRMSGKYYQGSTGSRSSFYEAIDRYSNWSAGGTTERNAARYQIGQFKAGSSDDKSWNVFFDPVTYQIYWERAGASMLFFPVVSLVLIVGR